MTAILEINDTELLLYQRGLRLYHAPAIAIAREDGLIFGEAALRLARIHPRQAHQQYLSRLSPDPLPHPTRDAANLADLIYHQLREVAALCDDDMVIAVPGTLSGEQLGVLLGIGQEAGLKVSGFVDAAVAAVSTCRAPEQVCYLDLYLQHVNITELTVNDEVQRTRAYEIRECGLSNLLDGWVNLIADRFVRETRFDPLVTADTEQQLYNQVYDWLMGGTLHADVAVEIQHADLRRKVEVPRVALEQKAAVRFARVLEALQGRQAVRLSARAARVPGLSACLREAGLLVEPLALDAVAAGCTSHLSRIRSSDGELRLITRLPTEKSETGAEHAAVAATRTAASPASAAPTHLLLGHHARPIAIVTEAPLEIDSGAVWLQPDPARHSLLKLNGSIVTGRVRVEPGDRIETPAGTFQAIRVEG